jgi:hypothetical protein
MHLDNLYYSVLAQMERGEAVPLDDLAALAEGGYVLPTEAQCDEEDEGEEVSPNEVTVSFADYTTGALVDVTVDSDGDFWITDGDLSEILLSPAGAMRLAEILADALAAEEVA